MRNAILSILAATVLTGCGDPVVEQAARDTRHEPVRADSMLAVGFRPGTGQLDAGQADALRAMVVAGRRAQRDEFMVVADGSGGTLQNLRMQQVRHSLANAGARWVGTAVEPAMSTGPDQVVVVRSEYRIGASNCPDFGRGTTWNPNESVSRGFGCADAYNMGQMLARPRDAAVGRDPGAADGTVNAEAIQRYREGRVRTALAGSGAGGGSPIAPGGATGGGAGGGGSSGGATGATAPTN